MMLTSISPLTDTLPATLAGSAQSLPDAATGLVHQATLAEVLDHFGQGTPQRQIMARRLTRVYKLATQTGHLARFIIFGSFVTNKPDPGDIDIFLR